MKTVKFLLAVFFSIAIAACGGGGGGTPAATIPAAPINVQAVAGDRQVTISWNPVAGATSYNLYMATLANVPKNPAIMHHSTTATSITPHIDLINGIAYYFMVTALNATSESGASAEVSATPLLVMGKLNDTGQTLCYDGTNMVACATANTGNTATHPRQDGRFGRDAKATAGTLAKTGAGAAGFDFTKVCMNGTLNCAGAASNAAAPAATAWACTQDNNTNLVWSLETQSAVWANATTTLPTNANNASRCGFNSGWRLPTRRELLSIAHHGTPVPAIDVAYFPATVSSFYWSNDTYAPVPAVAWYVDFNDGFPAVRFKTSSLAVRLVRSDGSPPAMAFTVNADGTVSDTVTGLMWDRCSQGQSNAGCVIGGATTMIWSTALNVATSANAANYKGYNDWRLPNKNELESLVDITDGVAPAIDLTKFPATPASAYWSSTTRTANPTVAWSVGFNDGNTNADVKASSGAVRLVRGGQLHDTFDALAP